MAVIDPRQLRATYVRHTGVSGASGVRRRDRGRQGVLIAVNAFELHLVARTESNYKPLEAVDTNGLHVIGRDTTRQPGRPKGALGTPLRADLEVLWLIYGLQQNSDVRSETLRDLRDFANAPGIDFPAARALLVDADRTTHAKRLRRWAVRYPTQHDLLTALKPERARASSNASGLPADALCSGPSWEI